MDIFSSNTSVYCQRYFTFSSPELWEMACNGAVNFGELFWKMRKIHYFQVLVDQFFSFFLLLLLPPFSPPVLRMYHMKKSR